LRVGGALVQRAVSVHAQFSPQQHGGSDVKRPGPRALPRVLGREWLFEESDDDKRRRFGQVAGILERRIELLVNLAIPTLDRLVLEKSVRGIGGA
jgi:hypothetical protein